MGWLIALLILVGLAMLPLRLFCLYNQEGTFVQLRLGPIKLLLVPHKKKTKGKKKAVKKKKTRKKAADKTQKPEKPSPEKSANKSGGDIKKFYPLIRVALEFLDELRRRLVVKELELKIILAGGDPCDLAVNYGKSWAALGNLMPHLERYLDIRKRELQIECDFTGQTSTVYAFVHIKITLGRSLWLLIRYGIRAIREYLNNTRKGGAQL